MTSVPTKSRKAAQRARDTKALDLYAMYKGFKNWVEMLKWIRKEYGVTKTQ